MTSRHAAPWPPFQMKEDVTMSYAALRASRRKPDRLRYVLPAECTAPARTEPRIE